MTGTPDPTTAAWAALKAAADARTAWIAAEDIDLGDASGEWNAYLDAADDFMENHASNLLASRNKEASDG